MNKTALLFLLLVISLSAQEKNKTIIDEKSGKPMLIGICDRTAFADTNYAWWFNSEYNNYEPDSSLIKSIAAKIEKTSVTVVMGSWCSDSKREVPRFFKILDKLGCEEKNINLICVDRKKEAPDCGVDKMNIQLVPTFIFMRNGEEIGRIIETPKKKLEEDILEIIEK